MLYPTGEGGGGPSPSMGYIHGWGGGHNPSKPIVRTVCGKCYGSELRTYDKGLKTCDRPKKLGLARAPQIGRQEVDPI